MDVNSANLHATPEAQAADALGHSFIPEAPPQARKSEGGGFDFLWRLLDIVNPLQHIPVVSTVYRAVTGDEIDSSARLVGGTLFGGPLGLASASFNVLLEETTGQDLGDHALALFANDDGDSEHLAGDIPVDNQLSGALPQPAIVSAQTATRSDIVWNGPRVIVPTARPQAAPAMGVSDTQTGGDSKLVNLAPGSSPKPEWLDKAVVDARAAQAATRNGETPLPVTGDAWVSHAMMQALDKYEALARARAAKRNDGDS